MNGLLPQIWRRRRVFALVFALTLLPALAAMMLFSPVYYAAGTVVIGNQEPASSSASAAWIEKLGDPADLESQLQIIQSRRMLRLALARPGVIEAAIEECRYRPGVAGFFRRGADCSKMTPNSQELVDYVEARYAVRGVGRSRIISIGYQSPLPGVAFVMANALIVTYLEDQRAENARAREVTAAWLLKEGATGAAASTEREGAGAGAEASAGQARQRFYQDLYSKAADIETERRVLQGGGRLVSLAELPKHHYFPKRKPLTAAALTLAFMLATLAALRSDVTDGSVRRTQELEEMAMIPVLGILPRIDPAGSDSRPSLRQRVRRALARRLAALLGADSQDLESGCPEESVQTLYTRLMQAGAGTALRGSILVCSATQGEGKTFTAMALAKCAARAGRKVLAIDCNLRRPALTEKLKQSGTAGLAEILRGEIEPEQAVTEADGVSFIARGAVRGGPSLLLMEGGMQKLMSWAERYDFVLLDGPAVAGYPDAGILAQCAAGVLWCVRWGHAQRADVKAALDGIAKPGVRILGFAVTQASMEEMRFYESPRLFGSVYEARR